MRPLFMHQTHHPLLPGTTIRGESILDVPLHALANCRELVMVILVDRSKDHILLEVENDLGWKLHFGCIGCEDAAQDPWQAAETAAISALTAAGVILSKDSGLRPAGVMVFSFSPPAEHLPMRIRVLEAKPDTQAIQPGVIYSSTEIPYHSMWADDKIWMPTLLATSNSFFQGHFAFSSGPGAHSKLLNHNWQPY